MTIGDEELYHFSHIRISLVVYNCSVHIMVIGKYPLRHIKVQRGVPPKQYIYIYIYHLVAYYSYVFYFCFLSACFRYRGSVNSIYMFWRAACKHSRETNGLVHTTVGLLPAGTAGHCKLNTHRYVMVANISVRSTPNQKSAFLSFLKSVVSILFCIFAKG